MTPSKTTLLALFIVSACTTKDDSFETRISGRYKVTSIQSDIAVDLNHDGISSNELYDEFGGLYRTPDNKAIQFFDFESITSFMEVRPLEGTTNDAQLIQIRFPDQHIGQTADGDFYLTDYLHAFLNYSYEFRKNSNMIDLINNNPDFVEKGSLRSLESLSDGQLELEMTKQLFDFKTDRWVGANLVVRYQKVE